MLASAPAPLAALFIPVTPPLSPYCGVVIYEDLSLPPLAYKAVIVRDKTCRIDQVARLRKTSTMNLGARYQPIKPLKGAWELKATSSSIPGAEFWTLFSWRWQFWDGSAWQFAVVK